MLQSVELLEFMLVPVFATRGGLVNDVYGVSDLFALALVTGTVLMLAVKARATVLVVILTLLAGLVAPLAGAANLVVTTPADVANGDTSGPEALIGNPGPDGISLREAMLATNGAPGPHTITFAPPLAGQSIVLTQGLPFVSQDHITLTGLTTSDGKPNITIDGSHVATRGIIFVRASHFKMSGLRMVGASSGGVLLLIRAGTTPHFGAAPQTVTDIRIDRSSFSNFGFGPNEGGGIELGTDPGSAGATMTNVVITNNTFDHFGGQQQWGDGILVRIGGDDCLVEDVVIFGNTFLQTVPAIELGTNPGANSRLRRTRILHNVFTDNGASVALNPVGDVAPVSGSRMEDTLIEGNVFDRNLDAAIQLHGGVGVATGNVVSDTRIVNNLIVRGACPSCPDAPGSPTDGSDKGGGIFVNDNDGPGATDNRVDGISIVNNTIVRQGSVGPSALSVLSSGGVTGLTVLNTILWGNAADDLAGVTPDQVRSSITSQVGFAGVNGNIAVDPDFVAAAQGDFHLKAGSPAIDAGSNAGAPSTDLECRIRIGAPDIGALEFGSPPGFPSCMGSFTDVPLYHPFFEWIEALIKAGITSGCSTNPPQYCPDASVTRAQMAVFLLRGIHGAGYDPPTATGTFTDVPTTNVFAKWIEQLAQEGITAGCSTNPSQYCPDAPVTRGQMAVFLLRARHGAGYQPPDATGMFNDVPVTHIFAKWIEQLAQEGITAGCSTNPPQYCPDAPVTRGQMAVFLVRAFGLPP